MSNMAVARRVHYVMRDSQCRPFDIVRVWDNGMVNGILLLDGTNDRVNLPWSGDSNGVLTYWVTSVHEDNNKNMGTWHWPERAE